MSTGLESPVETEAAGIFGGGFGVGVDGYLELFVAEDGEAFFADQFETSTPVGEFFADEPFNAANVIDIPTAGWFVVHKAGAVGDGVETEEGLALFVGKLFGGDGTGAEAALVLKATSNPGTGEGELLGSEVEGDLELKGIGGDGGGFDFRGRFDRGGR